MEWTATLSVDIQIIDSQHKRLFGYMNELYDALVQQKGKDTLTQLFKGLEDYTHTHFGLEEIYFKEFHYERLEEHIAQHTKFITTLQEIKKGIIEDKQDVEDLLEFLVNWLMKHIKGTDHQYITCFHEHGIQ